MSGFRSQTSDEEARSSKKFEIKANGQNLYRTKTTRVRTVGYQRESCFQAFGENPSQNV